MPVRWVSGGTRWLGGRLGMVTGSALGNLLGVVVMALGWVLVLPLVWTRPLDLWMSRRDELAADAIAVQLGYADGLLAAYELWEDGVEPSWWQRMRSTHPTEAERRQAVLTQLGVDGAGRAQR